jgi:phosphoribosylformylglycinamidine synthase
MPRMAVFHCEVFIRPRADILDPQGDAVGKALEHLNFTGVSDVKVGRYLTLDIDAADAAGAEEQLHAMCEKLLTNPIIEDYTHKVTAE